MLVRPLTGHTLEARGMPAYRDRLGGQRAARRCLRSLDDGRARLAQPQRVQQTVLWPTLYGFGLVANSLIIFERIARHDTQLSPHQASYMLRVIVYEA